MTCPNCTCHRCRPRKAVGRKGQSFHHEGPGQNHATLYALYAMGKNGDTCASRQAIRSGGALLIKGQPVADTIMDELRQRKQDRRRFAA